METLPRGLPPGSPGPDLAARRADGTPCLLPRDALDALQRHLARLQADLACKASSMLLDAKCMDTRRKLAAPAATFAPQVDTFARTTNRTLSPLRTCPLETV